MPRRKGNEQRPHCIVISLEGSVADEVQVVGPFGNYEDAQKVLEAFRNNPEFSDDLLPSRPTPMVLPVSKTLEVASLPGMRRR